MGRARSPWLPAAVFMWEDVWYVWYLGVYFPGCSWVPGVEMWLLHGRGRVPTDMARARLGGMRGGSLRPVRWTTRVP